MNTKFLKWDYDDTESNCKQKQSYCKNSRFSKDIDVNSVANSLVRRPVDYKTILGYIARSNDNTFYKVKWDKETEVFVSYIEDCNKVKIIDSYIKSKRDFESDKWIDYVDELI